MTTFVPPKKKHDLTQTTGRQHGPKDTRYGILLVWNCPPCTYRTGFTCCAP